MVQKNMFPLAEDLIVTEWNWLRAAIALNQTAALATVFAFGAAIGVFATALH